MPDVGSPTRASGWGEGLGAVPLEEDGGGVVAEVSVVAVHEAAQSLGEGHAFTDVAGEEGKEAVEAEFLAGSGAGFSDAVDDVSDRVDDFATGVLLRQATASRVAGRQRQQRFDQSPVASVVSDG